MKGADMMRWGVLLAVTTLSACSWLGGEKGVFRDRSLDYRHQTLDAQPLNYPQGQKVRPARELYPAPAASGTLAEKFEVPRPKPLQLDGEGKPESSVTDASAPVATPVLASDGNGYPVLRFSDDFNLVWDRLSAVLGKAGVKVDDRDRSVGLYFIQLPDDKGKLAPYQLKLSRGVSGPMLSLQQNEETVAPQGLAEALLDKVRAHWPSGSAAGEKDGKA